jgi:hypothetical protein
MKEGGTIALIFFPEETFFDRRLFFRCAALGVRRSIECFERSHSDKKLSDQD